jgi:hypothetical protein
MSKQACASVASLLSYSYLLAANHPWTKHAVQGAYHVEDAPDPGPAGAPQADGGVHDLDRHQRAGDGANARAAEQAALGCEADQTAGDGSQEQPGCTRDMSTFRRSV